ncbi:MAG TPA: aminotransferase class V-fold PLP-dependent enzyme [Myxococcales bacterium]|jgi:alanine-glyoxylate transaminase/serine-glyoxylate transaminase/serine-pyruvate transaminase
MKSGRHFLQIPGPTNVPDRVLRSIDAPTIDHRGPEFGELTKEVLAGLRAVFQTRHPVVMFPASGTGAWEAALVNTLSPGDRVLGFETGHFATLWAAMAQRLGLEVALIPGDWRHGIDPARVEEELTRDAQHSIKAVCAVHNETSTGVTSRIAEVRAAIDRAKHPALFLVDTISSLASIDYRHDEWRVDVTVGGSQKGLMLPPGLSFNALSPRALEGNAAARAPRSYWDWKPMLETNPAGFFPYTPATNLLYGLRDALRMLSEEGLTKVFARHARHAQATRRAVQAWGLELNPLDPREHSNSLTAVRMPDGHDEGKLRGAALERFDLSLGQGLGKEKGRLFRIGHLGWFNDLMLCGTLAGVEMALQVANVPFRKGGVAAAMELLGQGAA